MSKPPTPKRVQMGDIARMAGVSTATVSRAMSGHPSIPPATRERITELARSLNYQVNAGAANLRKGELRSVAVCILTEQSQPIHDPFVLSLVGHLADELDRLDYAVVLTRASMDRPERITQAYDSGRAAGIIVIGQFAEPMQLNLPSMRGVPMVVWGAALPDMHYPVVGTDNRHGGYLACQHLLARGCRRIAFVGEHEHPESMMRFQGYQLAHQANGLASEPQLCVKTPYSPAQARTRFSQWLDEGHAFDGVMCVSDVIAINVIAALSERGIRVPQDVKVTGYDDVEMASHVHPSITTVRQPVDAAAQHLVAQLLQRLKGEPALGSLLATDLLVRESTG